MDTQSPAGPGAQPAAIADESLDELQEPALAEAAAQLVRRGAIVIALFNLLGLALAIAPLWGVYNPSRFVMWGFLGNSALALGFAALTFHDWFRRHWRIATLILCAVLIGSATLSCTVQHNSGVLLLDLSLLVMGAGAFVPWAPRWQALLAGLALLAAGAHFLATSGGESAPVEHVFGLILSIVAGQLIASLQSHYRREITRAFAELQASHDRLRVEMSLRELTAHEREAAQGKLRESEQSLRRIFDASLDAISVARASDGRYVDVNREFLRRWAGRTDIIGSTDLDLGIWVHPEQRAELVRRLGEGSAVRNMEVEFYAEDGRVESHLLSAAGVTLHGQPCIIAFTRNISDLKEAERKVRESEATLRRVFDAIPDAVIIARMKDASFVDANSGIQALGMTREEALGGRRRANELFPDKDARLAFIDRLNAEGTIRNFEANAHRADGTAIPTLVSSTMVTLRGEPCAVVVVRDISEMKATEIRLRESEATLRKIFDACPDTITLNRLSDGTTVSLSGRFASATGFEAQEALGRTIADLGLWTDGAQLTEYIGCLRSEGVVRNMEITVRTRSGREIPCLISAAIIELSGEQRIVSFTRDISVLKLTQAELIEAREAALAASRAKSEFLSSMSHEIRTPLNSILGMAELLAETEVSAEQRHFVNIIVANGSALLQIINDVLDLARIESGRITLEQAEFDLRELVAKALDTLAIHCEEKNVALTARVDPEVPTTLVGDQFRLRQVLINLIGNAVKFTDQGEVEVTVERDAACTDPGALRFTVRDTGIGIAPEKLDAIFSPFTQADSSTTRKYGGSGLGLSIVRRLVTLMGGEVSARSELGKGSTFWFSARFEIHNGPPLSASPSGLHASNCKASAKIPNVDPRPLKILLADDSEDNRALIRAYLKKTPYQLDEAEDGREAVSKFAEGAYDLVLMDIQMPVMDGYDATKAIRSLEVDRHSTRTPIVALTASAFREAINKARRVGCDAHIAKPVSRARLLDAIYDATRPRAPSAPSDGSHNGATPRNTVVHVDPAISDLLPGFLARKEKDARALLSAIACNDFDAVALIAHQLKGQGGSYGLDRVSEIGRALEDAARRKDEAAARRIAEQLRDYLAHLEVIADSSSS